MSEKVPECVIDKFEKEKEREREREREGGPNAGGAGKDRVHCKRRIRPLRGAGMARHIQMYLVSPGFED